MTFSLILRQIKWNCWIWFLGENLIGGLAGSIKPHWVLTAGSFQGEKQQKTHSLKRNPWVPASITTINAHITQALILFLCVLPSTHTSRVHPRLHRRVCVCLCMCEEREYAFTPVYSCPFVCVCCWVIYHLSLNRPPSQKLMKWNETY